MRTRLALAGILSATAALAQQAPDTVPQGPPTPDMVRALCRKDGCDEFRVVSARPIRNGPDGTLRVTQVQAFHSGPEGRTARKAEAGYVYCSATRPAVIAQKEGRTVAYMLAPFAPVGVEEARRGANFVALYFAACHGPEAGRAAVQDQARIAQALGYRAASDTAKVVELSRAEDILSPNGPEAGRTPDGQPRPQVRDGYGRTEAERYGMGRDDNAEGEAERYGRPRGPASPDRDYGDRRERYADPYYRDERGGPYRSEPYAPAERRYVPRDDEAAEGLLPPARIPYPGR